MIQRTLQDFARPPGRHYEPQLPQRSPCAEVPVNRMSASRVYIAPCFPVLSTLHGNTGEPGQTLLALHTNVETIAGARESYLFLDTEYKLRGPNVILPALTIQ